MAASPENHIAVSFANIHSIITRGLKVSIECLQGIIQRGIQDERSPEGLYDYIRALCSVLHSHHLTEDEVAFPTFRDKMPEAPFDTLIAWHQEMVGMLDDIKLAVERCAQSDQPGMSLTELENGLTALNESWQPHIQMETDEFISRADALVPVEEQLRLIRAFAEHGVKIAVPHPLTVPFLLYNLPPEDRAVFAQGMPAEVVQHLVPVVWKAQWEPMKPYLLE